tara:strand:- start:123 stop:1769 length:1647 start_codon:yes stop_codon:yes gene_type:complete
MSQRVLFVVYDNGSYDHVFPMGVGALAAVVKRDGHDFEIWNQDMHHWPDDHLRTYLDENKFDVIIFSLIAGYYQYQKMKSLAKAINNSKNRPFFLMGGYGPTPEPEFFINKSGCDAIGMGEGEVTIPKLLEALEYNKSLETVPGLAWMENGKLKKTPRAPLVHDLDSLPTIPYEKFPMNYYRMLRMPKVDATDFCFPLMSARGCSFKCTFCYRMDPGYRMRTPVKLLDEIELLYREYGINYIAFQDDLLMSSVEHTEAVCLEFLKRDLPIRWNCNGRLNYCSEELLQLMKDAGCHFINYGIESMDQKVLNNMKKGLRPEMIVKGIEDTLKVGISPGLNFIFGNIGDNEKTIEKAVDFLIKYDDFAQKRTIRPVTPYPGSPLYYEAIKRGLLDKENPAEDFYERKHLNSDLICCNFTELSDEKFYDCLRWANSTLMKNYYERQKTSTLTQIDHLYKEKDATFRGFRHNSGKGQVGDASIKSKNIRVQGNEIMDGLVNWEGSQTQDGERFNLNSNHQNQNADKGTICFDNYLIRKKNRALEKAKSRSLNG